MASPLPIFGKISTELLVGMVFITIFSHVPEGSPIPEFVSIVPKFFPQLVSWAKGGTDEATTSFLLVSLLSGVVLVWAAESGNYGDRSNRKFAIQFLDNPKMKMTWGQKYFLKPMLGIRVRSGFGPRLERALRKIDKSTLPWAEWQHDDFAKGMELARHVSQKSSWLRADIGKFSQATNVSISLAFVFMGGGSIYVIQAITGLIVRGDVQKYGLILVIGVLFIMILAPICFRVHAYLQMRQTETMLSWFILKMDEPKRPKRKPVGGGSTRDGAPAD